MRKTTKKEFKIFQAECEKWIEIFGLKSWRFIFKHEPMKGFHEAAVSYSLNNRDAIVYLFPEIKDYQDIKLLAFHEMCEVLIARLYINAKTRFIMEDEIQEAVHEIILTLENVLFPKY